MKHNKKIEVPDRLREIMEYKLLTATDIAVGTGISVATMYAYINGRYTPDIDRIKTLAKYFNVSELWLLGYDVPMREEIDPKESEPKVYIVANTLREDFRLHTATTDKELAEAVYMKLKNRYLGTDFEDDLKILEFGYENSLDLLNGHLNDITEDCLRSPLIKEYPYNLLVALAEVNPDAVTIPTERISLDIEEGLEYALSTLLESEHKVLRLRYQERKRLREIGEYWQCTHQNVSALEQRALTKLLTEPRLGYIQHGKKGYDKFLAQTDEQAQPTTTEVAVSLSDLNLPTLALNALTKKGYKMVSDLIPLTKKEISVIRNLGPRSICDIAQALENIGICNTAWSEYLHKSS